MFALQQPLLWSTEMMAAFLFHAWAAGGPQNTIYEFIYNYYWEFKLQKKTKT